MVPEKLALMAGETVAVCFDSGREQAFEATRYVVVDEPLLRDEAARTAAGLIPYVPRPWTPPPSPSRWQRFKQWVRGKRERLGEWIAGRDFDDREGW